MGLNEQKYGLKKLFVTMKTGSQELGISLAEHTPATPDIQGIDT